VQQQREDYMLNEQLRRQHEEAAQAYLDDLMSSSAPACYLPLLLQLVSSPAVVLPLRVRIHRFKVQLHAAAVMRDCKQP
jgi:hypothetical protein